MNVNTSQNNTGVIKGDFRQCTLVRKVDSEIVSYVCYIPIKLAKVGKQLEIKNDDNEWLEWMILQVSDSIVTDPIDSRILIKAHRRATGDSMPKNS